MTRAAFLIVWLFSLLAWGSQASAGADEAPAPPSQVVERLHGALLEAMKGGQKLGFEGRRALLEPVMREVFDFATMARMAAGAGWTKMSDEDHQRLVNAFAAWSVANYASQFKDGSGDKFTVDSVIESARDRTVKTTFKPKDDEAVEFDYRLRQEDGQWRILDIYLDGAISQLAMRRSEFGAILDRGTPDQLIAHIEESTKALAKG
jgi:phospholipid transport system substrate-binding protein